MTNKKYCLFSLLGMIFVSFYPIVMGVQVVADYLTNGYVDVLNYPKYIIPYTPICIALILAVAIMPVAIRLMKRFAILGLSLFALGIFFACEIYFENIVVMNGTLQTSIENWQMFSCVATSTAQTAIQILVGEYSPTFKFHFYLISIVVILAVLNCIVGFAMMLQQKNFYRKRPLIVQTISTVVLIGLCILACFTAFFRNGQILLTPLSAVLTSLFFIAFGVTVGVYVGSFFYQKGRTTSILLPVFLACMTTTAMYAGELILLGGNLYQYGTGFLFEPLGRIPFAIIDLMIIVLSGVVTYLITRRLNRMEKEK